MDFNTIKALKLGVSDRQDHQELVKLMDQMEPGEYKFPNQAAKALVTKYAKY
jgi:6-pyruvoyl-tetrahydropterin synthase